MEERVFRKRRMQQAAKATARSLWGQPAPCPACGFLGVLLHVDPVQVVMRLACRRCGTAWQLGEADVDNPPDAEQRARTRALKQGEAALRNARLAAAEAEAVWQSLREQIDAGRVADSC
jgi:hypothetical protein